MSICKIVDLGQGNTDQRPPVKLAELVVWIEKHASDYEPYIDYQHRTIKDAWGNEVVLVSEGDELVGVGSPGPDGKWQGGAGDDIVITLEQAK